MKQFNLPARDYPITIRALRSDNREVVWSKVIDLPNSGPVPMVIPPLRKIHGVSIIIQVVKADGSFTESPPPPGLT